MTAADFTALLPLLVMAGGATLVMLQIAFWRRVGLTAALTTASLVAAAASGLATSHVTPLQVTPLLLVDGAGALFTSLFALAGAVTAVLSSDYVRHHGDEPEEYFLLLILATLGASVLACANHLASLLLGMELMSISLYALIAYPNRSVLPLEAAVKYLVLSGAASATLLFGFALLYTVGGTLEFAGLGASLGQSDSGGVLVMVGAGMVFVSLGFKLSVVPFHLWTPDVYDGAPAPVSGYIATVGKAAVFVALLRLFVDADLFRYPRLIELTGLLAILGMLAGNLLALLQTNIKRMLAYSSIAHIGYLLIVLAAGLESANRALAQEAALFYLVTYTVTTIAAFALLTLMSADKNERENVQLDEVRGLFWSRPVLAMLMTTALLSLAGIPLTAGFIAKFYLFGAAVSGGNWGLLAALVVGSAIGIYYYLRVIYTMSSREPGDAAGAVPALSRSGGLVSGLLIAGILLLGTLPQPVMAYLRSILQ